MKMGQNLNLEQTQKLIITPELKQAIKLLQMSKYELEEYINKELESNPVLEKENYEDPEGDSINSLNNSDPSGGEVSGDYTGNNATIQTDKESKFDLDWQEYFADSSDLTGSPYKSQKYVQQEESFESYTSIETTFSDYLNFQLGLLDLDNDTKIICDYIIGSLDTNGYLSISIQELAKLTGYPKYKVNEALDVVQSFEPTGVAARDLKECLLLQVNERVKSEKIPEEIIPLIENHLPDIAENKLLDISKSLRISVEEVQRLVDYLRTMNPKPAASYFTGEKISYVVPEAVIRKIGEEYVIIMNDNIAPNLKINPTYRNLLMNSGKNPDTEKFLHSRLDSAMWLIKAIEQRRRTIYKVIETIVEVQYSFFEHGVSSLKSLTLNDVAERIGVHESTVSRATANKYVQTPRGICSLRFFFDSSSSTSVKHKIKQMIDNEDSRKPLSDDKIASCLEKNEGIKVSRRTVAKYRKELQIPASSKRKRFN